MYNPQAFDEANAKARKERIISERLVKRVDELLDGEVMKLEFGCRIELSGEVLSLMPNNTQLTYPVLSADECGVTFYSGSCEWTATEDQFKVLGKPITLSDVLKALEASGVQWQVTNDVFMQVEIYNGSGDSRSWDLKEKHLDDQSDQTKEWLYNLIK